ncbi:DUF6474 family protein [Smaragdicoccus niigatensis]|uniref:DUF6474 family protein n=1 Tax=Smaragdicoccus niigatensis TaxID=359359 RepID=UPI000382C386|nr:DUF6474 family protein [Smaragdicoccus niigatensis]
MGLFSNRKRKREARRAKAEAKALMHKAKVEAKANAKNAKKQAKKNAKSATKLEKAQISTLKAQENHANKAAAKAERDRLAPKEVKKLLGTAKVVAPIAAPLVYQGATWLRGFLDERKAAGLGVPVGQLGEFGGHGGRLSARIASADATTAELLARSGDGATKKFADATRARLAELNTAVHAAENMPPTARKSAHQAISNELSRVETNLLDRLGVH